jgi:hypothetical protein
MLLSHKMIATVMQCHFNVVSTVSFVVQCGLDSKDSSRTLLIHHGRAASTHHSMWAPLLHPGDTAFPSLT